MTNLQYTETHDGYAIVTEDGYTVVNPSPIDRNMARLFCAAPDMRALLIEMAQELHQLHAHYYSECDGGCPADGLLKRARNLLGGLEL